MTTTHRKKPLNAHCLQWTGLNIEAIEQWCIKYDLELQVVKVQYSDSWLLLRRKIEGILSLPPEHWLVMQSNGELRVYSPEKFNELYEEL